MMTLESHVQMPRRFVRSIRIDSDLHNKSTLEGFICPQSFIEVIDLMLRHLMESEQGAFTWTGPYGIGKSSLMVAVAALFSGEPNIRKQAVKIFGRKLCGKVQKSLPLGRKGWKVIPVIAQRDDPVAVIGSAIRQAGVVSRQPRGGWTEQRIMTALSQAASNQPGLHGGVMLLIDEMGKFLEAATQDGTDLHLLQQLAEVASRSQGRLIIVGALHQAFEEYSVGFSQNIRKEWAKVQGRFVDLLVNTSIEEQANLISRAIQPSSIPRHFKRIATQIARAVHGSGNSDCQQFTQSLNSSYPLHPIVSCLLGVVAKREFGQSQRSTFSFLGSAEPYGFREFLQVAKFGEVYGPDRLFDYLRFNVESSIMASPDGHRWSTCVAAVQRCESVGGTESHMRLLKSIAMVDLVKDYSRISATTEAMSTCVPNLSKAELEGALTQLSNWSLIAYRKFRNSYSIYAGSDFDIDDAVRVAQGELQDIDYTQLSRIIDFGPIVAKRHYHETGALRWFNAEIVPISEIVDRSAPPDSNEVSAGKVILALPMRGEPLKDAGAACRKLVRQSTEQDLIIGVPKRQLQIVPLAREFLALESVKCNHPALADDDVARREVLERHSALQLAVEAELKKGVRSALWYRKYYQPKQLSPAELSSVASTIADRKFCSSPIVLNELLNRQRPSASAIAAQNALMRRMVLNEHVERLGIQGFPSEGGLFDSIIAPAGIHARRQGKWKFVPPGKGGKDPSRLLPMWRAATRILKSNMARAVTISEIFEAWGRPPYGVKAGLMPVLAVAFILTQRERVAIYRDDVFRSTFDELDAEYLAKDASAIQLRWMKVSKASIRLVSDLATSVRELDGAHYLKSGEPIDVARGLVGLYDQLPQWTKRTSQLSDNAIRIRDVLGRAKDPNELLFTDIPKAVADSRRSSANDSFGDIALIVSRIRSGLDELMEAYPAMLRRLGEVMLTELRASNGCSEAILDLHRRAESVGGLTGDYRLDAFVGRLNTYDGAVESLEGIMSLLGGKPPREWTDLDLDKACIEITDMAQRFVRAETFARVKGRPQRRHAMAVVVGTNGSSIPVVEEFDIAESDRIALNDLVTRVSTVIDNRRSSPSENRLVLAALAELFVRYTGSAELDEVEPVPNGGCNHE